MTQPPDPVALPLPTLIAFVLHIAGGTIGLVSGTVAIVAAKGSPLHRLAGNIFFASMMVMAGFAVYLAVVRPGQIVNLVIAIFAAYLIATAWLAAKRTNGTVGRGEKFAFAAGLLILAPFAVLSFQLAFHLPLLINSAIPLEGPVLIALYSFTGIIAIAVVSDAIVLINGGITGPARIARHLWRMCLGLTLATGSAFTNGLPRLLPGPMHVPAAFFLPQFIPVVLLIFWMIRVRFTGWLARNQALSG